MEEKERKELFRVKTMSEQLKDRAAKERGYFVGAGERYIPRNVENQELPSASFGPVSRGDDCFAVDWCMVK